MKPKIRLTFKEKVKILLADKDSLLARGVTEFKAWQRLAKSQPKRYTIKYDHIGFYLYDSVTKSETRTDIGECYWDIGWYFSVCEPVLAKELSKKKKAAKLNINNAGSASSGLSKA